MPQIILQNGDVPLQSIEMFQPETLSETLTQLAKTLGVPPQSVRISDENNRIFHTMRDEWRVFWEDFVQNGQVNRQILARMKLYFRGVNDSHSVGNVMMYYLLDGMRLTKVPFLQALVIQQDIMDLIDAVNGSNQLKAVWENAMSNESFTFLDENQGLAPLPVSTQDVDLVETTDPTVLSAFLQFELPLNANNQPISYVFAQMMTTKLIPMITLNKIYKLNKQNLSEVQYGFNFANFKNEIMQFMSLLGWSDQQWKTAAQTDIIFLQGASKKEENIGMAMYSTSGKLNLFVASSMADRVAAVFANLLQQTDFDEHATSAQLRYIDATLYVPSILVQPFLLRCFLNLNTTFVTSKRTGIIAVDDNSDTFTTYFWTTEVVDYSKSSKTSAHGSCVIQVVPYNGLLVTRLEFRKVRTDRMLSVAIDIYRQMLAAFEKEIPNLLEMVKPCGYTSRVYRIEDWKIKDIIEVLTTIGYERGCTYQPIPISAETASQLDDEEYGELEYRNNRILLSCHSHNDNRFFGLKRNTQGHVTELPYLPCCYQTSQKQPADTKDQQLLKVTQAHAMPTGHRGTLPLYLQKFLYAVDPQHRPGFVRVGVSDTYWSFLKCILVGLGRKSDDLNTVMQEISQSHTSIGFGAQQLFIVDSLEVSPTQYLDPRDWMQVMEAFFDCKIYVFSHITNDDLNAHIVLPRFKQFWATRNVKREKCLFLYEHENIDDLRKCELIGVSDEPQNLQSDLTYDLPEVGEVYAPIFMDTIINFKYNMQEDSATIMPTGKPNSIESFFTAQVVDDFGKCRVLLDQDNHAYFVDPLQPFELQCVPFTRDMLTPRQRIDDPIVAVSTDFTEVDILVSDIVMTVKVMADEVKYDKYPTRPRKYPDASDSSEASDYQTAKKMAHTLQTYFAFFMARKMQFDPQFNPYLHSAKERFLLDFVLDHVTIDQPFVPNFPMKNIFVDKSGQFVIPHQSFVAIVTKLIDQFVQSIRTLLSPNDVVKLERMDINGWVNGKFTVSPKSTLTHAHVYTVDSTQETHVLNEKAYQFLVFVLVELLEQLQKSHNSQRGIVINWPELVQNAHSQTLMQIRDFFEDNVVVNEDAQYVLPTNPTVNMDALHSHGFVDDNSKFVMKSHNIRAKILYDVLYRLSAGQDLKEAPQEIPDFYHNLSDWSTDPDTFVVNQLDNPLQISHTVRNRLNDLTVSDFVRHPKILDGALVYVNAEENEQQAVFFSKLWVQEKYSQDHYNALADLDITDVSTTQYRTADGRVTVSAAADADAYILNNEDVTWYSVKPLYNS